MINKKLLLIIKIFVIGIFFCANGEEFDIKSEKINISGLNDEVEALGSVEIITDNNLKITGDKVIIDKKNSILKAYGNIVFFDQSKNIKIFSEETIYEKKKGLIYFDGKSRAELENNYIFQTENLFFDRQKKIIYSDKPSILKDENDLVLKFKKFNFNLDKNIIKVIKFDLVDVNKNTFYLDEALINIDNKEIIGKEAKLYFDKNTFGNKENDPRLFGRSLSDNNNETIVYKGIFTTCKFRDKGKCPPWTIKADQVRHNKNSKTIEYKNAWLSLYDKPVIYFPFFFHPDPTVKRQSGLLMPVINNSKSLGSSIQIPYYNVLSDNKDFTISPRFFFNDKFLVQNEYRQVNKDSNFFIDQSMNTTSDSTNSHLFTEYTSNFNENKIKFNLQTTSNKKYLKKYEIESPLIDNYSTLNSLISFEKNFENSYFYSSIETFEDLTKPDSDSYEFIYPNYVFRKDLNLNLDGEINFYSTGYQKKYDTNKFDAVMINDLIYDSKQNLSSKGFRSNYSVIVKNINSDGKNSDSFKNKKDNKLLTAFLYNYEYPLYKEDISSNKFFTPIISARLSPTETKDISDDSERLSYINLFNLDRLNKDDVVEGGESVTLGANYIVKSKLNREILNLSGGQVFRLDENNDLPNDSSIGQKVSDLIGNLKYSPTNNFNINYSFSVDNNLGDTNYDFVETNLSINNFFTSFKFLNSKNSLGDNSYIANETMLKFSETNSLSFSTNKNLDKNLTEYYDLIYEYKNDCLAASIEYRKSFYKDVGISPDESLFFSIKLIPFGNVNSPNVN